MAVDPDDAIGQLEDGYARPEKSITSKDRSIVLKDDLDIKGGIAYFQKKKLALQVAAGEVRPRSRFRRIMVDKNL